MQAAKIPNRRITIGISVYNITHDFAAAPSFAGYMQVVRLKVHSLMCRVASVEGIQQWGR